MKLTGLVQVIILLFLIAFAASCEVGREYANRVFKPTLPQRKTDSATAVRFMQFDSDSGVDSIDLKDFANREPSGINKPISPKDSTKNDVVVAEKRPPAEQPIDATRKGSVRTKKVRE